MFLQKPLSNSSCSTLRQACGTALRTALLPQRQLHDRPLKKEVVKMQTPPNRAASSNSFILPSKQDFKKVEAGRPDFDHSLPIKTTKTPSPDWHYGDGVNSPENQHLSHVEIDPSSPTRSFISNYRLLIAGIPRPISFVSTISADGTKTNLAPFSYFQVVDHDPPIIVIGFSARKDRLKDTRRNLVETGECVISVVSEHMIEAVNGTSLELPYGVSEWRLSGLHAADSSTVKPKRVKDAVFSMEGKLLEMKELDYGHAPGEPHGSLAIIRVSRFWVREDAVNEAQNDIDLSKMRPLVQLGGISYGRIAETFELPRPGLEAELKNEAKGLRRILEEQEQVQVNNNPKEVEEVEQPRQEASAS